MKNKFFLSCVLIMIGILVIFFACNKSSYSSNSGNNGNGGNSPNSISIANLAFSKPALTVAVGTTVTWMNNDNVTHTVTSDNGTFDSGNLNPGSSFSYTFNTAGTYSYHCKIHTYMTGVITVATH